MREHQDRSELSFTYAFVAVTVLGSLAMAFWGLLAETTAGPGHDDEMFAGIGYFFAAVWGIPAVIAAVLLTAGRVFTDQYGPRLALAVLASAVNFAPWALLLALR